MDGIDFRQYGYLFLLDRPDDVHSFREALALQQALGVPSRELSVEDALAIVPQLDAEGLLAATYCELDGYASPESVVQWYAQGLDVRQGCEVTGDSRRGRSRHGSRDDEGPDRLRRGRLLRRRVVARGGGDGRRRPAGRGPEALDVVLARGRRAPGAAAADDRLLDLVLLPPRRPGRRLRREGADARGGRRPRTSPAAAPRGAAGADVVVGLLRDEPRPQRARRPTPPIRTGSSTRPASRATASSRRRRSASTSPSSSPGASRRST